MLSQADNELLTRTGPGTLMGNLMRRYWLPALLSSELTQPDCPPVRVRLLGEDLVAFRDSTGGVGLLAEACPHRGASLFLGRNEEFDPDPGLRCVYHGWKFDRTGRCLDMPNEPAESDSKSSVTATAYPCLERAGVVWAYMGPSDARPEPPALEWALVPEDQVFVSKRLQECNYAQAMEGGIDSSHVSFLHSDMRAAGDTPSGRYMRDTSPRFEIVDAAYGLAIGARREADADHYYWRITPWLFPWYTIVPPYWDKPLVGHAWVPIDDESCWTYSASWHPTRPLAKHELEEMRSGRTHHPEKIPGTFRSVRNKSNDYLIDREAQRSARSYTGIFGISNQDAAVLESMGSVFDRTREHLGSSDAAIIQMRRRLLEAARALERGVGPPCLDPDAYRVRSVTLLLPRQGVSWPETAAEAMRARPDRFVVSV